MSQPPQAPGEDLRYCPVCGAPLVPRQLPSEDRPRLVCDRGHILYVNPKLIVSVILEQDGSVVLMRRAIEPRYGTWTFPGGFLEIDESVEECAVRETQEEVGLDVRLGGIIGVYSRPGPDGPGIVALVYRGSISGGKLNPGREALEARWFPPDAIPWDDLAYDTTHLALRDWLRGGPATKT